MQLSYYVNIERNYDVLKAKSACVFVEQKYKLQNKNEAESKMENPTDSFREMNLVFQLI